MSAMYSLVNDYEFQDWSGTAYLRRAFDVDRKLIAHAREAKAPHEGEFERAKVTAEHHTHFRPEEIWEVLRRHAVSLRAASLVLGWLRQLEGVTEAIVSTFLLYILYARPQVAYLVACSRRLREVNKLGQLVKVLKELSTPMKSMHVASICDYSQMFELTALINRGVGEIDWEAERENRVRPDVVNVRPADVYREACNVFKMGLEQGFRYPTMDLQKYIKARWEWVPTGSVHSQYSADGPYIKKAYRHRNKFVALNMMSRQHIRSMFDRPPEVQAWTSVKYEWAKKRAIYGVDLTSTVITNFAMYRCEEVLKHKFPIGEESAADRVHRRLKGMLTGSESLCYDFDDFNAQHSIGSMKAVLLAYLDMFRNRMSEEQVGAMEWVVASVENMIVNNNETVTKQKYKIKGTLLSGWRLTTFMNTILNYVYFKIAGVFNVAGVSDSVHNGDDVLLSIRNLKAAVMTHDRMAAINARAQASKCNVFSIGEFLRVEHKVDKETGLGAQYLTRGMATLAHSRVESQAPVRVVDAVKAMVSRCEEASQRAVGAAEKSYDLLCLAIKRLATVFSVDPATLKKITKAHLIVGGALACPQAAVDEMIEETVQFEEKTEEEIEALGEVSPVEMEPGIRDYADVLNSQFGEYMRLQDIRQRIRRATERQLSITRKTWLTVTNVADQVKYKYGREKFREYRSQINIPHLEKGRFIGLSPIALLGSKGTGLIKRLLADVNDVHYALAVLL
ncbi:MAG: RNA-dependent RNA polymerase [Koper totivirus 1]|nr:MAG: RNA-dependent RNA polymerase [Koper totivirus 1]